MSVFSGDFLGFQIGNVHSSQLNITRVSSGDRYSETLTPNLKDTTAQTPGNDGTYYWDTFYVQKPFIIDFAFDNLRDEDIRRLKQTFNFKGLQSLIFDETPYKKYLVKCSAPPTLKYISFDLDEIKIYKGEGSINLIAYYPYGIGTTDIKINSNDNAKLGNAGDIETPIKIYYSLSNTNISLTLTTKDKVTGQLNISNINKLSTNDKYICIDTRTHLVEGLDSSFNKTGNLYNKFITSGDFFLLPLGQSNLTSNVKWKSIEFNYLYY